MSLGMATSNPTVTRQPSSAGLGHAPSAFRSPSVTPHDFTTPSPLLPSRPAPPPPGLRRDSSLGIVPTQSSLGLAQGPIPGAGMSASGSRFGSKSATNSPNPNRFSSGASGYPAGMPANGYPQAGSSNAQTSAPPPRPSRAGTMPLDTNMLNGMSANSGPLSPPTNRTPGGSPISHSHFLPTAPPPMPHQPYSNVSAASTGNPYAAAGAGGVSGLPGIAGVEKGMEDVRLSSAQGVGLGMPMAVQEPRDKELPKEPTGRSRSGTGKSTKEKKSVFGFMQGELSASELNGKLTNQTFSVLVVEAIQKVRPFLRLMIRSI